MNSVITLVLALRMMGIPASVETFSVSAYWNGSGAWPFEGLTASGVQTVPQSCACGPSFAFGTVFFVNGAAYVCTDRGSAITDGHLDLYMASEAEALTWGRQELEVVLIR